LILLGWRSMNRRKMDMIYSIMVLALSVLLVSGLIAAFFVPRLRWIIACEAAAAGASLNFLLAARFQYEKKYLSFAFFAVAGAFVLAFVFFIRRLW